jgi:hypothetical protein
MNVESVLMSRFRTVYKSGTSDFVLKNSNIAMTISKGRIVSLVDIVLECVILRSGISMRRLIFC